MDKKNKKVTNEVTNIKTSKYKSFKKELVKNKKQIDLNIDEQHFKVIDAKQRKI